MTIYFHKILGELFYLVLHNIYLLSVSLVTLQIGVLHSDQMITIVGQKMSDF